MIIDKLLVGRLIASQFPAWAGLPKYLSKLGFHQKDGLEAIGAGLIPRPPYIGSGGWIEQ